MGLFSSSYEYRAYAASSALFEEDNRPNTIMSLMLNGIIGNISSPSESIIIGLQTNLYARARSMWRYALRDGGYIYGLPETNQPLWNITTDLLRPFIEAEAGGPIDFRTIGWNEFPQMQDEWVEYKIATTYMDPAYFPWPAGDPIDTNWSPVDTSVEIPVEDPGPALYYESNNNYSFSGPTNAIQVTFPYTGGTWPVAGTYDLTPYEEGTWIYVRYRLVGETDEYRYWVYQIGSNAIPALEAALEETNVDMQYLPIAVLMHDQVWFDEAPSPPNPEWEDTLDRLLRDMALDPYEIKEEYLEQWEEDVAEGNISGDVENWDFFITFGVPAHTRDRGGREYLFRFFQFLKNRTWTTKADYEDWLLAGEFGAQPYSELVVEEGVEFTGYRAQYRWSYIEEVTVAGEFTPPGWTEPLRPRRYWSKVYDWSAGSSTYQDGLKLVFPGYALPIPNADDETREPRYMIVTRMNEDGTHTHILMFGLSQQYIINTKEEPYPGSVDYRYRTAVIELFPEDPEQESEFRWPMHIGSLNEVSAMQREAAVADGLCATIFLVQETEVKWYQKGFFKWLIIIIVIVIVILLWQYGLLPYIATLASAATGATALALWALYVVLTFAIGYLISFAGSLIGGTLGQIFVIVAMFMAAGGSFQNFGANLQGSWANITTAPSWGSAIQFINAVSTPIRIGQVVYQEYELHKLEEEMEDFVMTAKEKYERLQDAWDSLQTDANQNIDPMELAKTFSISTLYEDPTSFYYRTLHANPGTLGYDLIENFTEMATMLPKTPASPDVVQSMMDTFAKQRGQV